MDTHLCLALYELAHAFIAAMTKPAMASSRLTRDPTGGQPRSAEVIMSRPAQHAWCGREFPT